MVIMILKLAVVMTVVVPDQGHNWLTENFPLPIAFFFFFAFSLRFLFRDVAYFFMVFFLTSVNPRKIHAAKYFERQNAKN